MAQRRRLSRKTSPKDLSQSLLTSVPCEKLLLPFLREQDLLRYLATCSTCCASAHSGGRLELSHVAHLPASPSTAERLAERLHLASIHSIVVEGIAAEGSEFLRNAQLAQQRVDVSALDSETLQPLCEQPLWHFMVGLSRELAFHRQQFFPGALLPKLLTLNLMSFESSWPTKFDGHELLENTVATVLWEAPRLQRFHLPRRCSLIPANLQKALLQHPGRAATSRVVCGWLPLESTSSLQTAHLLDAMVIKSPQDAFLAGQFARSLTLVRQLIALGSVHFQAQQRSASGSILKAFADGYCTRDVPALPQAEELLVNAQTLANAGTALSQLVSEMHCLHSLRLCAGVHAQKSPTRPLPASSAAPLVFNGHQELSQLHRIEIRGGFALDSLNLATMLSSACKLQVLDLSGSEFGDADAELLATANVGPLPKLDLLGFRGCKLQSPPAAAALARAVNRFGSIKHIRMQANRWRVEAHRAFAENLAEASAKALISLEAGYSAQLQSQVPSSRVGTADARGGPMEWRVEGDNAAETRQNRRLAIGGSEKLHFLSQFGVGLWLSAVASRLACSLQELRLERLEVGVVALQILRRRLRNPMALRKLALSTGCTGLGEKKAGAELASLLAKVTPRLQCLMLAGSDASPALLQGMVEAISRPPSPATGERGWPEIRHLCWIEVDNVETFLGASTMAMPELSQAFRCHGCSMFQGLRSESSNTVWERSGKG